MTTTTTNRLSNIAWRALALFFEPLRRLRALCSEIWNLDTTLDAMRDDNAESFRRLGDVEDSIAATDSAMDRMRDELDEKIDDLDSEVCKLDEHDIERIAEDTADEKFEELKDKIDDVERDAVTSSDFDDLKEDVERLERNAVDDGDFEDLQAKVQALMNHLGNWVALSNALQVVTKTSAIRLFLERTDPTALAQCRDALQQNGINPDPVVEQHDAQPSALESSPDAAAEWSIDARMSEANGEQ